MLEIKNIKKDYGNGKGVKNISLQIKKGEICALLGHNGCGKTTTFRILLGLLKAEEGEIYYENKILKQNNYRLFGYMPEERSLLRGLSVEEHIYYLARLKRMEKAEIDWNMKYWLEFFCIEKYRFTKIIELSKGNQQKVQLVCALIHNPDIVILDEPLNGLDVDNMKLFKKLLKKLKKENKIVFISSHQIHNIEHLCTHVVYLKDGEVILNGNIREIKKGYEKRIVTFPTKEELFLEEEGVLSSDIENEYQIISVENKYIAYKIIEQLNDIDEFKLEYIPLSEIIKEKAL